MTRTRAPEGRVHVTRDGAVVRVRLDRPPLHVLDRALNRALATAVRDASADASVAAVVLHGGDAAAFCAGVEVADHLPDTVAGMLADFHAALRAVHAAECLTVAVLHGVALGGGFELALACDVVLAERTTRLGFPEIALGCYPPAAAALLPARVGWGRACELVLSGEPLSAVRAAELGLVQQLCDAGAREAALARRLAPYLEHSPAVLREAKRALRLGTPPLDPALAHIEQHYLERLMPLTDAREGIAAWLERRAPQWRNR